MYLWIVITGGIASFICSMGIGANDAANAFASSVGAKTLTIKQAAILAVIFETSGAVLMGNHVTETIRKGISDYECFEEYPEVLIYGCMYVIVSVAGWLFLASYLEMPVSTTHSCVGGMIGMTIATVGSDCVIWYKETDYFPYIGGVSGIVLSWFLSPFFSGIVASFLFAITRKFVLRTSFNSYRINFYYPLLVGFTLLINSFFIFYKGAKGIGLDKIPPEISILISFGIAFSGGALITPFVSIIKDRILMMNLRENSSIESVDNNEIVRNKSDLNIKSNSQLNKVVEIHDNAEKFDLRTEEIFKYLQIFSASCDAFSHGANDVANAVGPFAAIFIIYNQNNEISKKLDMEENSYWILGMGGLGIAIGLLVYGKKIIYAIGSKLCKITPSRGTCIELGSALVIIGGSRLKIPLSTTHCQVGATVGIGLLENKSININKINGINWWILNKTIFGWLITCVIVGLTAGFLSAQGIYAPSKNKPLLCNISSI
jgi:sodium-dependent phosphate transporter